VQITSVQAKAAELGTQPSRLQFSDALSWLRDYAFDMWANSGCDNENGGFFERIDLQGRAVVENRRVRVQARQIYCFAHAGDLGWSGDWRKMIDHGERFISAHGRDSNGYLRGIHPATGFPADAPPDLYDQAFYLLALAQAFRVSGDAKYPALALALLRNIRRDFAHPMGGFYDTPLNHDTLRANPHMHLLEAALAWIEVSDAAVWRDLAHEIVRICKDRLIDPHSGAVLEYFNANWTPVKTGAQAIIEPGHLFEWTWLLSRYEAICDVPSSAIYRRLYDLGQRHGVCQQRGVAINELHHDLSWRNSGARLWPQTERLKASLALAQLADGAERDVYVAAAQDAIHSIGLYFDDLPKGLWRDKMADDGSFVSEPAPASTFYHLVCAFAEVAKSEIASGIAAQRPGKARKEPVELSVAAGIVQSSVS
jgi:mannose/cellobiose epimerase-like protein (N-acyl-D-glucosamine 2-epimerase family)